jgi:hypothetical protein
VGVGAVAVMPIAGGKGFRCCRPAASLTDAIEGTVGRRPSMPGVGGRGAACGQGANRVAHGQPDGLAGVIVTDAERRHWCTVWMVSNGVTVSGTPLGAVPEVGGPLDRQAPAMVRGSASRAA